MRQRIAEWRHQIGMRLRRRIYHITEMQNWSLYWDGYYISKGLRQNHGRRALVVEGVAQPRNQILHYGSRHIFLNSNYRGLHPSNHVFLTWFHGHPQDPDSGVRRLFEQLPLALPTLRRIVTSCQMSAEALRLVGVPESQMVIIPLGVDLARFRPVDANQKQAIRQRLGIPQDAFCVASFQKDGSGWGEGDTPKLLKGPDIFLDTITQLAPRMPNLMVLLTGPSRGYVKKGLDKIGVRYIHQFLDDYFDIIPFYQAADLYLITSRNEGGPKALMESWATGIPVISSAMGMPADVLQNGQDGFLVAVEDVPATVEAARQLIDSPTLRQQFRRAGFASVKAFDWMTIASQYDRELYAPLLD